LWSCATPDAGSWAPRWGSHSGPDLDTGPTSIWFFWAGTTSSGPEW
jgi:hypothetical protein